MPEPTPMVADIRLESSKQRHLMNDRPMETDPQTDRPQEADDSPRARSRKFWYLGLFVAAVAVGVALYRGRKDEAQPVGQEYPVRHVILISLDTTRADHLGCYGNEWIRTPNLDALAAESIRFTRYMTVATTTLASHTSLFTGKYPHTHGVPRNGFMVSQANVMLTETLADAGFHCAAFIGSFALDRRFDFGQGFDHYDQDFDVMAGKGGALQNQRSAQAVTDAVIDYLDRAGIPRKLFLFVHYFDPHWPYEPPPPFNTMYGEGHDGRRVPVRNHPALAAGMRGPRIRDAILRYAGEVSYVDAQLGRLLDYLRRRGILDDAILIVTSDHGENLGEAPGRRFDHGWWVYEIEAHAVCLIRLPDGEQGGTTYEPLSASVDIAPTLLRYLGLPLPDGIDGRSIDLSNLGADLAPRVRFAEATKPWEGAETDPRWYNNPKARCARRGSFKYIRTAYRGTEELYDLATDPHEQHNLLANPTPRNAKIAAELRVALDAWTDGARPLPSRLEPSQQEETIRRLQSLGYMGGGAPGGQDSP